MAMVGDAKPVAFVEDTAVAPERLPEFYERFFQIVGRQGVQAACYGHADVGCLHIRPLLNVKSEQGIASLRTIAREVADLVAEFGGAMSGEHGDGLARSVWNARLFGPEVYACFEDVKRAFDPENRMNPGKVVAALDPGDNLRIGPGYHTAEPDPTILDFSNQGGFAGAVEMCSGVGACRKTTSGTLCPSYMVTRDEVQTTRGRANALRLVMTGDLPDGWSNETLHDALDLCLQCKACKSECPSNVDMAKLKAEVLYQKYRGRAVPLGSLLMAHIDQLNPIGSATAPLANWSLKQPAFRWLQEKVLGVDRRRILPSFDANHLRKWFKKHTPDPRAGSRGSVVLLDDCFTTYNTPDVGRAAVRVLEASGYRVELAGLQCCGRPAISKGLLPLARDRWRAENVRRLVSRRRPARGGADRRLRAKLLADARRRIPRLPPRPRRRRRCPLRAPGRRLCRRSSARSRATAEALGKPRAASRSLPAKGTDGHLGHGRRAQTGARHRGQGAGLRLLRHGRLIRLRAGPLRR